MRASEKYNEDTQKKKEKKKKNMKHLELEPEGKIKQRRKK